MEKIKPRFWKISPWIKGVDWESWKEENKAEIGSWDGDDLLCRDMLSTYATKEKFFKEVYKNTGNKMYKNPSKIESNNRYFQVKNFVWELKTGDILLAFKAADIRGEPAKLIGIGILGNEKEQNYQYDVTIHIKDVKWHEL